MTYEQYRWLLGGMMQVEPAHTARFYDEMGAEIAQKLAAQFTPALQQVGAELHETIAATVEAMKKRADALRQKESELRAREANVDKRTKQLEEESIKLALSGVLGAVFGNKA